jgi:LysM repeat protein
MKMKSRFALRLALTFACAPLLSAGEVERLRTLVAEQEMQIQQLELKIAQLTSAPAPVNTPPAPVSTPTTSEEKPTSTSEKASSPVAETCPEPVSSENLATYTVQAGDNMVAIARKHGTTSAILNELNGLKKDGIIRVGQKLKLPKTADTTPTEVAQTPTTETESPKIEAPAPTTIKHTVADKETFYSIAKDHKVSIDALVKENPSINPKALRVGQIVQIPASSKATKLEPVPGPDQTASLSGYNNIPISNQPAAVSQARAADKPVKITEEISYTEFAKQYNTTTARLDQLNGLRLDPTTVLAKGSELYIPAQP